MLLCMFVGTAWGQGNVSIATIGSNITNLGSLTEGSYVIFKNVGRNGYVYEQGSDNLLRLGNGAVVDGGYEYIWQVHIENSYYLFSSVTGKYISTPLDGQNVYTVTDDNAAKDKFTITKHGEDNTKWKLQSTNNTAIYWDGQGSDGNNRFVGWQGSGTNSQYEIIPVTIREFSELETKKKSLQSLIDEYSSRIGRINLQTTNSEAAFYLSATQHGDAPIDKMIDGKADTYYGSTWGSVVGHRHYWQVDLVDASALPEFTFEYITRADGRDTPTKIDIKGSKDGSQFTNIVSLKDGLPTAGGASYKSATISNSEGYRYIRFEIPSTTDNYSAAGNAEQEVTISLAEFALLKTEANYSDVDKYILSLVKEAQEVVDDENASQAEVDAALATLTNALESTVRYSFQYEGVEKYTQETKAAYGQVYPAYTVQLPYGISAEPQSTTIQVEDCGKVVEKVVELKKVKDIPFVSYASAAEIKKWYYMRMQTNYPGYVGDIADDKTINVANEKTAQADKVENFMWGFVGDLFTGITVVNKGTGLQLTSTGDGNATLTESGTAFFVAETSETTENAKYGFCLRKADSKNYLNANYTYNKLSHWGSTDAGSTFFLIDADMSSELYVSEVGYATLFLDYATYIPEDVEAYVVSSVDETSAQLTQVTGTLPARTGVIVKADEVGNYDFVVSAEAPAEIEANELRGTVEDTYVNANAYVLAKGAEGVALYKATLNKDENGGEGTTHFLNNANKAYLVVEGASEARFLSFDFGTETAIESVEGAENGANAVIYDLSGRRVQKVQKGLYIVNGAVVIK